MRGSGARRNWKRKCVDTRSCAQSRRTLVESFARQVEAAKQRRSEEFEHTTTAVKGLSPRMTYRQKGPTGTVPRNNKGPAFGAQSTAQYIRSAPGRKGGTHFGTARAPLPRHDEYDENIFSLMDLKDPMERSFLNQQKRVNRIKNMVNLIEKE